MLKPLFLTILLALTAPAQAASRPTPETSWETLYRTAGIQIEMPKIIFVNWFVPAISVCIDGENLRTTSPAQHCGEWSSDGFRCIRYEAEFLYTPRGTIPVHYSVAVNHVNGSNDMKTLLFRKPLDLAACGAQ